MRHISTNTDSIHLRVVRRSLKHRILNFLTGYMFLAPMIIFMVLFLIGPLLYAVYLSFFHVDLLAHTAKFIGFHNYSRMGDDRRAWIALWNTIQYVVIVVPCQTIGAMILAAMLNSGLRFQNFFRTSALLPTVTSSAVLSLIFMWMYNTRGLINHILGWIGFPPYNWLNNPAIALKSIMIMNIWSTMGWFMIIFLAALQDIPNSIYEAASIDGANTIQKFFRITVPMIRPVTIFVVVMGIIGTFQLFDQAYFFSHGDGGPDNSTLTLVLLIYQYAFKRLDFGYAGALAVMLSVVIVIATIIQRKIVGDENNT